jgi:hypothetical protein
MMIADLWVVLTVLGFFAVCVAFVRGCDRIIGPDDAEDLFDDETPEGDASPVGQLEAAAR